jgi:hypothetical protein
VRFGAAGGVTPLLERRWLAKGLRAGHISPMTAIIVESYEALRAAGAPEDKAQAAARALAEHDRRFDHVGTELATIHGEIRALEGQVVMVKWITGATFAGILALILRPFVQG